MRPSLGRKREKCNGGEVGERKIDCIWGIKMHEMYLLIKIWSNVKSSSCFHFMAVCQDDLT